MNSYNTNNRGEIMPTTSGHTGDTVFSTGQYKMTCCADAEKPCIKGDGVHVSPLTAGTVFPKCPICEKSSAWFEPVDEDTHSDAIDPFKKLQEGQNGKVYNAYRPVIRGTDSD